MAEKTILLVEDDADSRTVIRTLLEHFGYRVLECDSGEGALNLAQAEQPDAILMDITLTGMDGWTATELIKNDRATSAIPVLALSGEARPEARERALSLGCSGFLTKPCHPRDLLNQLDRILSRPSSV